MVLEFFSSSVRPICWSLLWTLSKVCFHCRTPALFRQPLLVNIPKLQLSKPSSKSSSIHPSIHPSIFYLLRPPFSHQPPCNISPSCPLPHLAFYEYGLWYKFHFILFHYLSQSNSFHAKALQSFLLYWKKGYFFKGLFMVQSKLGGVWCFFGDIILQGCLLWVFCFLMNCF